MAEHILVVQYTDPGIVSASLLSRWWQETEKWAAVLGVELNEVTASFRDKPKGLVNGSGYDLNRYQRRIQEQIEIDNVEYAALTRLADGWKYKVTDWEFHSDFGRFNDAFAIMSSGICLETLRLGCGLTPAQFARDAMHHRGGNVRTSYGMAVVMPTLFVAPGYAMGVASGEMPKEMIWDCAAWRRSAGKQCDHVIRNVFGYNILNPMHLEIDVGGQRLGDWIEASGDRGRLELQDDGLILWTFQEGDEEEAFLRWDYPPVAAVREQLKEHRIFPWQLLPGEE
jgi:hypothetical protein